MNEIDQLTLEMEGLLNRMKACQEQPEDHDVKSNFDIADMTRLFRSINLLYVNEGVDISFNWSDFQDSCVIGNYDCRTTGEAELAFAIQAALTPKIEDLKSALLKSSNHNNDINTALYGIENIIDHMMYTKMKPAERFGNLKKIRALLKDKNYDGIDILKRKVTGINF